MEEQATGADRARLRQHKSTPWETMNRLLTVLIAIFILSSATGAFGFYVVFNRLRDQAKTAFVTDCVNNNITRAGVLEGLELTKKRAEAALKVALPAQRPTSEKNLHGLEAFIAIEEAGLPQEDCSYPPTKPIPHTVAPSTTAPVASTTTP